ncbi:hypothetical protein MMC29_007851, partial [Sticta canariensis]|nr:hypothetical protein [Sticta canariensis]
MTTPLSNGAFDVASGGAAESICNELFAGSALKDLPKSNNFTISLPPDPEFKTPSDSDNALREDLGPRLVKGALYTYVRPEKTENSELLGISQNGMRDVGLKEGEEKTQDFKQLMAGNRTFWDEGTKTGIYPWAQCYGGWQFGSWAGQLGDGRAISLFETTNPSTQTRYELQLKGAGKTPYSRFGDGKAVLRSSIREFVVSEALNALRIPTTRALALTLTPNTRVRRERLEPSAIVARFAQSWIRIGTFDILRARGDRALIRTLASYVAEHVFPGWLSLPSHLDPSQPIASTAINPPRSIPASTIQGPADIEENRFTRLYREIVRRNALTVANWQAYAFTNGVLNTDNTSILGLSLDFGPFAFLDNFDPSFTPNHDDHALRYSYQNQPSIIWWNLVRLGESFGELIGAGSSVDDETFINDGVSEDFAPKLIHRAQEVIPRVGEEFKTVFLAEYNRLMRARLGLISESESDFDSLFSRLLGTLEELELDFNNFFRRLSSVKLADLETESQRQDIASIFFHAEGITPPNITESVARTRLASWLLTWRDRVSTDWVSKGESGDAEREDAMKRVNPKFIPRSWVLDEVVQRVEKGGERDVVGRVMAMAEKPFADDWGGDRREEER